MAFDSSCFNPTMLRVNPGLTNKALAPVTGCFLINQSQIRIHLMPRMKMKLHGHAYLIIG